MQAVLDVQTMRESDARTVDGGIAGRELMLRAAKGIFDSYAWTGNVAIVCGMGNNAGDGYALAWLLHGAGISCTVFQLSEKCSADGAYYLSLCKEKKIPIRPFTPDLSLSEYGEIVDCIFGTGFRGAPEGIFSAAIEAINQSGCPVISVDINSGLDGDSGTYQLCVRSDLTVSVGSYKTGHFLGSAKDVIGRLVNVEIGIKPISVRAYLVDEADVAEVFRPRRHDSHKGVYGYVTILGGCTAYSGAVKLANMSCAALRAGCGVAKLAVPASLASSVSPYLLESTLATLPERDGSMIFDSDALDRVLAGQAVLAVGMGWGSSPEYEKILAHILTSYAIPVVIDADGLNTLSRMDRGLLKKTRCRVLLTPHMKEMERLSGVPVSDIQRDPIGVAVRYARENGVCVLLKGATTVVTDGENAYLVDRGCAGMATAGSGDVLSGILVGLLGHAPLTPLTAACGAFVAGLAGELAEQDVNPVSMLASDTVAHIGAAVSRILKRSET